MFFPLGIRSTDSYILNDEYCSLRRLDQDQSSIITVDKHMCISHKYLIVPFHFSIFVSEQRDILQTSLKVVS